MKCRLLVTTAVFTVLLVALCGCTTYDNFKQGLIDDNQDTSTGINIGIFEPTTGVDKDAALPEIQGIELAHKMQPKVMGKDVNLIYADNSSDINAAEPAINTLIAKNPTVILGSYGNLYSLIAADYMEKAKIPAITMTNTNPLVTRNNSYYFRICYIDSTQGRLMANYLNSINVDKVGVLRPSKDDAAMAMDTVFTNGFEDFSGKDDVVGYHSVYNAGDTDFTEQLEELRDSGVKHVLLLGDLTSVTNIINQAADMGLNVTFLGDISWGGEDFREKLNENVNPGNVAFVQFFVTDGDDEKEKVSESRQKFLDAYQKTYGSKDPEEAVGLGYDAYMMALDAIEKATAGKDEIAGGETIRDLLLSDGYVFEGASGTIMFNKRGDPKKNAYICTWNNNSITTIYTIETKDQ